MTWTEVTDDAIKIGLGAILGGLFSLLVLWRTHRHEIQKERSRRKQDSLEKIAEEFELFHSDLIKLVAFYNASELTLKDAGAVASERPHLVNEFNKIPAGLSKLLAIEARLLLLGLDDSAKFIKNYTNHVLELITAMKIVGPAPEIVELQEKVQVCNDIRGQLYASLKSGYFRLD